MRPDLFAEDFSTMVHVAEHLATTPTVVATTVGILGAAGLAAALIPPVFNKVAPSLSAPGLGDRLPFDSALSDGITLRGPGGVFSRLIAVEGIDTHGGSVEVRNAARGARQRAFAAALGTGADMRIVTMRRPLDARETGSLKAPASTNDTVEPASGTIPSDAHHSPTPAARMAEADAGPRYRATLVCRWDEAQTRTMVTRHLIVLTAVAADSSRGAEEAAVAVLETAMAAVCDTLRHAGYVTGPLGTGEPGMLSPLLSGWAEMIHPLAQPIPFTTPPLGPTMVSGTLSFDPRTGQIEALHGGERIIGYSLSLTGLPRQTFDVHGLQLMTLPVQMTLVQHAAPVSRTRALAEVEHKRRGVIEQLTPTAGGDEMAEVVAMLKSESNTAQMLRYSMSVLVWGRGEEQAAAAVRLVRNTAADLGLALKQDTDLAVTQFWAQLPGYEDNRARPRLLESVTLTDLAPLESPATGLRETDWGKGPVIQLQTVMKTPFNFTFHDASGPEEPGHTVIFGPTGRGKTIMMATLIVNALERFPELRCAAFDREFGLYVPTVSMGGRYVQFIPDDSGDDGDEAGTRARLEPFARELTGERKNHIRSLLRLMADSASPETDAFINRAIRNLERQTVPADRRLSVFLPGLLNHDSPIYRPLARYLPDGAYGHVMAYEKLGEDALAMSDRLITLDMGGISDDDSLAPVVVRDVAFELTQTARQHGAPSLIVLDEAMALMRNRMFQGEALQWLDMMRKMRASLVFMFQRPGQLRQINSAAVEAMRTQTVTQIFLRDPSATPADYEGWGLTGREMAFIQNTDPTYRQLPRAILFRQPRTGTSVVLDVDLAPIGDLIHLLRSSTSPAGRARRLAAGAAVDWRPDFLDEVRRADAMTRRISG